MGQQVQFQMPSAMEQAVKLAVTVENVEKHKQMVWGSRKVFANKKEMERYRCNQTGHNARDCQQEHSPRNRRRVQGQVKQERINKPSGQAPRNPTERRRYLPVGSHPSGLQCFHCLQFGHLQRECPQLSQKNLYPNGQGSTYRSLT